MGSIMSWIHNIVHSRHHQRLARTEKLDRIMDISSATLQETAELKTKVKEYQEAEDPLEELMKTLNSGRDRRH